jgi:hypothetical protein
MTDTIPCSFNKENNGRGKKVFGTRTDVETKFIYREMA